MKPLVATAGLLAAGMACACGALPRARPTGNAGAGTHYEGTVQIDPPTRAVRASWRITLPDTADSVAFLLNEGLSVERIAGHGVVRHAERMDDGLRRTTVVFAAGTRDRALEISYRGVPKFGNDSINGIGGRWVELGLDSFWFPVIADFTHMLTAEVDLELPAGWRVASSGSVSTQGPRSHIRNEVPLIDIPFVASPDLERHDAARVHVHHAGASALLVDRVASVSNACARSLDAQFGATRPLPEVEMVVAPRRGPGYARKNYIVISREADTATVPLTLFVCHELAHYWSTGANPRGPENWLNESFAEFVAGRYARTALGDSTWRAIVDRWQQRGTNSPPVWTPSATARPSARAAYGKAPWILARFEDRIGSEAMSRILRRFMTEPLRTTSQLLAMIESEVGAGESAWLRAELAR